MKTPPHNPLVRPLVRALVVPALAGLALAFGGGAAGVDPLPEPALFEDVTAKSGIKFAYRNGEQAGHYTPLESVGGGVALIDYDGDGLLDIFVPGGGHFDRTEAEHKKDVTRDPKILGHPCRLYRNLGDFKFQDVTAEVFPQQPNLCTHGAAVADYDRDGWPDLLVTGYGGVVLYRNTPVDPRDPRKGRRFVDVTRHAGLALRDGPMGKGFWATSAAFADLDGDGFPDLYISRYVNWSWVNHPRCADQGGVGRDICPAKQFSAMPHALYRNDGKGHFIDVTKAAGIRIGRADQEHGKGLGVVIADINGDGRPDIYVANDTVDNFLYLNRSKPGLFGFDEVGLASGVARDDRGIPNGNRGVDVGDYNGSGLASLFTTTSEGELFALYRNLLRGGRCLFLYASRSAGIGAIGTLNVGAGTVFADVDGDGWEDLVIANGHVLRHPTQSKLAQAPVLLLNQGGGRFRNASARGGPYFRSGHRGRGLAVGDLNNDGRPDLVLSNVNEPVAVLRNVASGKKPNNWLGLELVGARRRDVVGSRVLVDLGDRKLTKFVKGGGSYLSAHDPRLLFGLGKADRVRSVTVQWAHGKGQTWRGADLAVNRHWRLTEGEGAAQPWPGRATR
jgi:enediyne biosynthesis protein E4